MIEPVNIHENREAINNNYNGMARLRNVATKTGNIIVATGKKGYRICKNIDLFDCALITAVSNYVFPKRETSITKKIDQSDFNLFETISSAIYWIAVANQIRFIYEAIKNNKTPFKNSLINYLQNLKNFFVNNDANDDRLLLTKAITALNKSIVLTAKNFFDLIKPFSIKLFWIRTIEINCFLNGLKNILADNTYQAISQNFKSVKLFMYYITGINLLAQLFSFIKNRVNFRIELVNADNNIQGTNKATKLMRPLFFSAITNLILFGCKDAVPGTIFFYILIFNNIITILYLSGTILEINNLRPEVDVDINIGRIENEVDVDINIERIENSEARKTKLLSQIIEYEKLQPYLGKIDANKECIISYEPISSLYQPVYCDMQVAEYQLLVDWYVRSTKKNPPYPHNQNDLNWHDVKRINKNNIY